MLSTEPHPRLGLALLGLSGILPGNRAEVADNDVGVKLVHLCGDLCMGGEYRDTLQECEGACQEVGVPCEGACQEGWKLCVESSICVMEDDMMYKECDGECVSVTTPCNGVCPDTTFLCGDECVPLSNTSLTSCQGDCQPASQPCHGECLPGLVLCGDECKAEHWVCGDHCVPITTPCNGACLPVTASLVLPV